MSSDALELDDAAPEVRLDIGRYSLVTEYLCDSCSPNAVKLFAVLGAKYANRDNQAWPSREKLARDLGKRHSGDKPVSTDTVDRAIDELVECGVLTVQARRLEDGSQRSNLYTLHMVPRFAEGGPQNATPGLRVLRRGGRTSAEENQSPENQSPKNQSPKNQSPENRSSVIKASRSPREFRRQLLVSTRDDFNGRLDFILAQIPEALRLREDNRQSAAKCASQHSLGRVADAFDYLDEQNMRNWPQNVLAACDFAARHGRFGGVSDLRANSGELVYERDLLEAVP